MKNTARAPFAGWKKLPTEDEVEVVQILLDLHNSFKKEKLINRFSLIEWGGTKKRSVPGSSPSPKENQTAMEGNANDGGGSCKPPPSSVLKTFKRKAKDDLMEVHQAMETKHKQLSFKNMKLKAKEVQKTSNPRNMEDLHTWDNPMKTVDHEQQQRCHQQITMFTPPTPQHHCLPFLVEYPDNDKLVGVSSFGLSNHGEPRVKIHEGVYDFMGLSQPLGQSECLVMDDDLSVRMAAAAARKRRMLKMKESKSSLLAMKLSRNCR